MPQKRIIFQSEKEENKIKTLGIIFFSFYVDHLSMVSFVYYFQSFYQLQQNYKLTFFAASVQSSAIWAIFQAAIFDLFHYTSAISVFLT